MKSPEFFEPNRQQRIWLHLRCPWRSWRQVRFHVAGIFREFGVSIF